MRQVFEWVGVSCTIKAASGDIAVEIAKRHALSAESTASTWRAEELLDEEKTGHLGKAAAGQLGSWSACQQTHLNTSKP